MSQDRRALDFELYFLSEVLKLPALHYGFWDSDATYNGNGIGIEDLGAAQVRFREELISTIPDGVASVLDVGAGIGDSAKDMARRGYQVVAISPDANHEQYYNGSCGPNLRFQRTTFEDFDTDARFDLLYFSESINYIDREIGLRQCRRLVKPGGHLLVSCTFRSAGEDPYPERFDVADLDYVEDARAHGFDLVEARDITHNVLPTVRLAHRALTGFVLPLMKLGDTYVETRSSIPRTLINLTLGRTRRAFEDKMAVFCRETDPEFFTRHMRYATLLLRDSA